MKKLSIIVPVYNVERWLHQCVDSLLTQTYSNIQIVLVNDGSTDSSGNICDEYEAMDDRITVVHCENGGQSVARNIGLNHACGDYIGFVDSDDYVVPEYAERLVSTMEEQSVDLLVFSVFRLRNGKLGSWFKPMPSHRGEAAFFLSETLRGEVQNISVCNKCYSRKVFSSLCFKEGIKFEDFYMMPDLFFQCGTVCYIEDQLYVYRDNPDSTMNNAAVYGNHDILTVAAYVIGRVRELYGEKYLQDNLWWIVRRVWQWVQKIYTAGTVKENAVFLDEVREFLKLHLFSTKDPLPHMRKRHLWLIDLFLRHKRLFAIAVSGRVVLRNAVQQWIFKP